MASGGFEIETDPLRPAQTMADIIRHELGIEVDAEAVVRLFKKRWQSLSALAHEIHHATA